MRPGLGDLGIVQQNRDEVLQARHKKAESFKLQSNFSLTARNFFSAKVLENGLEWAFNDATIDPFDCETNRFFNPYAAQILRAHQLSSNDDKNRFFIGATDTDPDRVLVSKSRVLDGESKNTFNFEYIADWVKAAQRSDENTTSLEADPDEFTEAVREACVNMGLRLRATKEKTPSGLLKDASSFMLGGVDDLFSTHTEVRKKAMASAAIGLSSAVLMGEGYLKRGSIFSNKGVLSPGESDDILMCAMLARDIGSSLGWGINEEIHKNLSELADYSSFTEKTKQAVEKIAMTFLHTSLCSEKALVFMEQSVARFCRTVQQFSHKILANQEMQRVVESVNPDGSSVLEGFADFEREPAYRVAFRVDTSTTTKASPKGTLTP